MSYTVLDVGNVRTKMSGAWPRKALDQALSFTVPGSYFNPWFKSGRWDGKHHLIEGAYFPSGLLSEVLDVLEDEGFTYKVRDQRVFPDLDGVDIPEEFGGFVLRPYQKLTVATMLRDMHGVLDMSVAGGKTLIAAAVIKILGLPSAYVVHTQLLLEQTKEVFEKILKDVGAVGAGHKSIKTHTVFMVQSLMRVIKFKKTSLLEPFRVLIVDEAHHVSSDGKKASWYKAAREFKNASIRFGLSATPGLNQKKAMLLRAATGPLIHKVGVRELQDRGYVAQSAPKFIIIKEPRIRMGESYRSAYEEGIIENQFRNTIVVGEAVTYARRGMLVMIFVDRIKHGLIIKDMLENEAGGVEFQFVSGMDSRYGIKKAKKRAEGREVKILIATRKLFGEGVDIPAVDVLINAAGGKSATVFTQMYGRGLRKSEGKEQLIYVDFKDQTHRYLTQHADQRITNCKKLKQTVNLEQANLESYQWSKKQGDCAPQIEDLGAAANGLDFRETDFKRS